MQVTLLIRNIPFELERTVCSRINRFFGRRPSSEPLFSGDTYRAMADCLFDETRELNPDSVRPGAIVYVGITRLREFQIKVLPAIQSPFILLTHQGDVNIDLSFRDIANHPKVLHWFAQNCLLEHPKVSPLPIGLEDSWRHNNGEISDFKKYAKKNSPAIPRIAYSFTLGTNLEKRIECYKALKYSKVAVELPQLLNSRLYRKVVKEYLFIASPPGNGLDCHRTWEAMYMHSVPLVEDNYMNRRFRNEGAPLLLVKAWNDLMDWTEEDLLSERARVMKDSDTRILDSEYWRKAFLDKR
jgi:hypothetical protein